MHRALLLVVAIASTSRARCPSPIPEGVHNVELQLDGQTRTASVFVPETVSANTESPLLFMYHGCGSSPEKFEAESAMNAYASDNKYINIYLKGTDARTGGSRLGWNAGVSTCNTEALVNDVQFTKELIFWTLENLCLDANRLYAVGFSNGGSMVFNLTCSMSSIFSGFAFVGSTMPPSLYPNHPTCDDQEPSQKINPILGMCGSRDGCGSTIETWFQEYSRLSACEASTTTETISSTSKCYHKKQCGPNRNQPLEYCVVDGLGHCWSGNDCCDSQCTNQDPENMHYSKEALKFFGSIPRAEVGKNITEMKRFLRR